MRANSGRLDSGLPVVFAGAWAAVSARAVATAASPGTNGAGRMTLMASGNTDLSPIDLTQSVLIDFLRRKKSRVK